MSLLLRLIVLPVLIFLSSAGFSQETRSARSALQKKLLKLPGIYVKKIPSLTGFTECFEIALTQPVDHENENGPKFTQRLFLAHKDAILPVLLETEGYGVPWQKKKELAALLNTNQIIAEHRYFDSSKPDRLDWKYLTIKQAASDHHRIIQIFKTIYPGKLITSGKSKGGMAALFHKFYFPEDAAATVAFVAPVMTGLKDPRFPAFLESQGHESEKTAIRNFQAAILRRRSGTLPVFRNIIKRNNIGLACAPDTVFEYSVVQYPYSYWQNAHNAITIPGVNATDSALVACLVSVVPLHSYSKSTIKREAALIYQAVTEFGYHGFPVDHLKGLLIALPNPDYSVFAPKGADISFNPDIMRQVLDYLQNRASRVIYLYGEYDPWTACAVIPSEGLDALKIIVRGKSHKFGIADLPRQKKEEVKRTLKKWIE